MSVIQNQDVDVSERINRSAYHSTSTISLLEIRFDVFDSVSVMTQFVNYRLNSTIIRSPRLARVVRGKRMKEQICSKRGQAISDGKSYPRAPTNSRNERNPTSERYFGHKSKGVLIALGLEITIDSTLSKKQALALDDLADPADIHPGFPSELTQSRRAFRFRREQQLILLSTLQCE